jgi:hypothetical protein
MDKDFLDSLGGTPVEDQSLLFAEVLSNVPSVTAVPAIIPKLTWEDLVTHEDPSVRIRTALNPKCPAFYRFKIVNDPDETVRNTVREELTKLHEVGK